MNPSANGWIHRYLHEYHKDLVALSFLSKEDFYQKLKSVGFIYGTNLIPVSERKNIDFKLTQEELAKVNLFTALSITYFKAQKSQDHYICINSIIEFYKKLRRSHKYLFNFKWGRTKPEQELEDILHQRIQTNDNYIQKNFSNIVTNALLFVDVLAFEKYLSKTQDPCYYATKIEELLVNTLYLALKEKKLKGKYDKIIIKLIQSSLRYHEIDIDKLKDLSNLDLSFINDTIEKRYFVDMMCITLYSDQIIDDSEKQFIYTLAKKLDVPTKQLDKSIGFMYDFVDQNKSDIYYFNVAHPVKHFYDKTYRTISLLINRNRKRIVNEIYQSKELMSLLIISTTRELNSVEKKKVKTQLIDIFKTIPSLTIFVLPGGSVLLPIIIKMIPSILPSSFNENLIDEHQEEIKKK